MNLIIWEISIDISFLKYFTGHRISSLMRWVVMVRIVHWQHFRHDHLSAIDQLPLLSNSISSSKAEKARSNSTDGTLQRPFITFRNPHRSSPSVNVSQELLYQFHTVFLSEVSWKSYNEEKWCQMGSVPKESETKQSQAFSTNFLSCRSGFQNYIEALINWWHRKY